MPDSNTSYETPRIVDYGDLTQITAGTQDGDWLDHQFPVNTPKRNLTFS
jgi:hypothetical protein